MCLFHCCFLVAVLACLLYMQGVQETLGDIRESLEANGKDPSMVMGTDCDVSSPGNAARLASIASNTLGSVDIWVNCAGYSGSFTAFSSMSAETIAKVGTQLYPHILHLVDRWNSHYIYHCV